MIFVIKHDVFLWGFLNLKKVVRTLPTVEKISQNASFMTLNIRAVKF